MKMYVQRAVLDTEYAHIEALIPVGVEGLPDDTGGMCLLCIYGNDCKGVWETEDLSFGQTISSDDCDENIRMWCLDVTWKAYR